MGLAVPLAPSLDVKNMGKLGPKFYGPFQIIKKFGDIAYRLQLPQGAKIHDVFQVGLLKPFHGELPTVPGALPPLHHGRACPTLARVIHAQLAHGRRELLVQWTWQEASDASWMELDEFRRLYPRFQLEDALNLQGGRDVMVGLQYSRRAKRNRVRDGSEQRPEADGAVPTVLI
jgi:hypothetical protein